jgi:two-component system, LytTR family, response regulator
VTHSVVVVDDEPPARAKLVRFISELEDFRVVSEADSVESAIAVTTTTAPEVLYLDIQLGARSGFEVLEGLRGVASPLVIFSTAYSEHAVRAFEVQALDYLLKPYDRERFLQSISRVRTALADPDRSVFEEQVRRLLASVSGRPAVARQILVRDGERAFFVAVDEIQRVAAAGNYVEVHTAGKIHLVRDSLSEFIAQLDPAEFLRVHRSHVVRVSFIAELRPLFHGDYELVLRDGQRLGLSRRYKQLLPEAIRGRL